MRHQRFVVRARPRALLFALACVVALAAALPSGAFADTGLGDRAGDGQPTPALPMVGDRVSERVAPSTAQSTSTAAPDPGDGTDVALIVGLSLAGIAVCGGTWLILHRRHHGGLATGG